MRLDDAIKAIERATEAALESGEGPWFGHDFTQQQDTHDPREIDHAIAAVLNAVADGRLQYQADAQTDLLTRMYLMLDGLTDLVDAEAGREKRREAGKRMRQITWQQRAETIRSLLKEAAPVLGMQPAAAPPEQPPHTAEGEG